MKKRVRRTKAKSVSKRARAKSKTKKTMKAKTPAKAKKTLLPKVKRVAKKAALAAGVAAIGTALSELQPEQKSSQQGASDQSESKRGNPSVD
jgi:ferric-dicitrate binding protein FerR (iron transport regulator)